LTRPLVTPERICLAASRAMILNQSSDNDRRSASFQGGRIPSVVRISGIAYTDRLDDRVRRRR
jgi:hypothetical protein